VLELARTGANVAGVVSFHGGLGTPTPEDAKNVKCKVLALHGADDPNVPPAEVQAFEKEMRDAKVDWQLVAYGGAVHSFTDWNAGNDNSKGAAYNKKADERSWRAMEDFFREILP
jgi:dienelactone hydrolase